MLPKHSFVYQFATGMSIYLVGALTVIAQPDGTAGNATIEPKSYRVTHLTRKVDELSMENSLKEALENLGKGDSDVTRQDSVGRDTGPMPLLLENRRLAKIVELLDGMAVADAESVVLAQSAGDLQMLEQRMQQFVTTAVEFRALRNAKKNPAQEEDSGSADFINWPVANYSLVFLVGRYSPKSLTQLEADTIAGIQLAITAAANVEDEKLQRRLTLEIFRQAYPKLLWINVYRLALERQMVVIPEDKTHRYVPRKLAMLKWSALPVPRPPGSIWPGSDYSDEDVFETFSVVDDSSFAVDKNGEDAYLAALRDAADRAWPRKGTENRNRVP